jgi:hypothetical protein|tara:strand:- start:62 stop:271 length:210 start_codon:yes stop_codon:yes gene_type:complete
MADISFHGVTKIEVLKRKDLDTFSTRDIIIHNEEYNVELRRYVPTKTCIELFLDNKEASKLVYNKSKWR